MFNTDTLQQYYDSNNYAEAIKYIQQFTPKDAKSSIIVNRELDKLKILDAKQKSLISKASQEDRESYFFMQSIIGNGTIPRNVDIFSPDGKLVEHQRNKFGQDYTNTLNSIITNDGKKIDKFAVEISDDDYLSQITANLGIDDINNNDLGIEITTLSNGHKLLQTGIDNHNLYKLYNAVDLVRHGDWVEDLKLAGMTAAAGVGIGGTIAGIHGAIIGGAIGGGGSLAISVTEHLIAQSNVKIKGIDNDGYIRDTDEFNHYSFKKAADIVNDAEERYNDLLKSQESEAEDVYTDIETTGFISPKHKLATEYLKSGTMSPQTYDKVIQRLDEHYDRLFDNANFADYDCYAYVFEPNGNDEVKEGVHFSKVDNEKVPDLQARIKAAKAEDRVTYTFAQSDGDLGTLITIQPKADKGVWSSAKDKQEVRVFVKGLFTDDEQVEAEQSTKFKATKLNSDMKRYNYELSLDSGVTVGRDKEIGAYTTVLDKNNIPQRIPISDEEMMNYLNEHYIMQDAYNTAILYSNGKGGLNIPTGDGKTTTTTIDDYCNTMANAAVNELFSNVPSDDITRLTYQQDFYLRLKKLIQSYNNKIQ